MFAELSKFQHLSLREKGPWVTSWPMMSQHCLKNVPMYPVTSRTAAASRLL
jgi:hypothetical protein